jgi:hypothetical protein
MNFRRPMSIAIYPVRLGSCSLRCGEEYHAAIGRSGPSVACRDVAIRSLTGEKRTLRGRRKSVVHDPQRHSPAPTDAVQKDYLITVSSSRGERAGHVADPHVIPKRAVRRFRLRTVTETNACHCNACVFSPLPAISATFPLMRLSW